MKVWAGKEHSQASPIIPPLFLLVRVHIFFWRQEEVENELAYLGGRGLAPSAVRKEPLIFPGAPSTRASASNDSSEDSAPDEDKSNCDLRDLRHQAMT